MKNKNVLIGVLGLIGGYFLLANKSFKIPALKNNKNIVDKSYDEYYQNNDSQVAPPFAKQHESTIAESQTIGTVGGGLTDIFKSIKRWANQKKYNAQLSSIDTAEKADAYYEA